MQRNPAQRQDLGPSSAPSGAQDAGRKGISSSERALRAPIEGHSVPQARELLMAEGVVRQFGSARIGPGAVSRVEAGGPVNHCHTTTEAQ